MASRAETMNAVLKGLGVRPTNHLLRWEPALKTPFQFGLLEVMRCDADGEVVTRKSAQSPLGTHLGHRIKSPQRFGLWDWLKVQMRIIR